LIAELRGSREAAHGAKRASQGLDDDVLLPDQLVDDEAEPSRAHAGDDHELPAARSLGALDEAEEIVETAERQGASAQGHYLAAFEPLRRCGLEHDRLLD